MDEIGYDSADHILLVANNHPFTATSTDPPTRSNVYATFISADNYQVLGHVTFEGATGLEQPVWDPELHRFFATVPGYGGSRGASDALAVIDPTTMKVEKVLSKPGNCHGGAAALGPSQHLLLTCGGPMMLNAVDGKVIATITQIGSADEYWYNSGDGRFYFTSDDKSTPPVDSLGVVDAYTGAWLQNVPNPGGRQAAALSENNRIFTLVRVTAAMVKDPSTDHTTCSLFGFRGTGCIAVFAHSNEDVASTKRSGSKIHQGPN